MNQKLIFRISAVIWAVSGIIILFGVIYPIISYQSPNIRSQNSNQTENLDYTKASNWFVGGAPKNAFDSSKVAFYTISVPKLKIENARVAIGGEDLSKSLIQYPGTALPGKTGNSVIFGHSILPLFYNPKDYMSIFSLLPTLQKGDEINVNFDGISYKYRVEEIFEVVPTDIQVLEQDDSDSFLTLVTCVPPGDPRRLKRLIVRARVVPPSQALNENQNNKVL